MRICNTYPCGSGGLRKGSGTGGKYQLIMAGATVLGYVLGEGLVDASNKGDKPDGNV